MRWRWVPLLVSLASATTGAAGCHVRVGGSEPRTTTLPPGQQAEDAPDSFGKSPAYEPAFSDAPPDDGRVRVPAPSTSAASPPSSSAEAPAQETERAGHVTDLPSWARRRHLQPAPADSLEEPALSEDGSVVPEPDPTDMDGESGPTDEPGGADGLE